MTDTAPTRGVRKEFASDIMYNDIVRSVKANEFKDGEVISGENTLIKMYGISLSSVRLATRKLVDNGYLVTVPKKGKYIRNPDLHRFKRILMVLHQEMYGIYSSIEFFSMQFLLGLMQYASKNNWYVQLVISSVKKVDGVNAFSEDINLLGIDGAVLFNFTGDHEMRLFDPYGHRIPTINSGTIQPVEGEHEANIDYQGSARFATEHLLARGHRRIAYLGERESLHFKRLRNGYEEAMHTAGVRIDPSLVLEIGWYDTTDQYYLEMKRLFERYTRDALPTAVVFGADRYTRIGLEVLKSLGLKVPEDISIVSLENSFEIQESDPQITAIEASYLNLGLLASELLNRVMFEPADAGPFKQTLPLQIIERASVRTLAS